jgi:hypothetical protein
MTNVYQLPSELDALRRNDTPVVSTDRFACGRASREHIRFEGARDLDREEIKAAGISTYCSGDTRPRRAGALSACFATRGRVRPEMQQF